MSAFDVAAGLVVIVSAAVGWIRGGAREVTTLGAIVAAAVAAMVSLRFTGPVARHAIATPWLANIAAILIVFTAVYIVLRVAAGAMTRRIRQIRGLGEIDRAFGAGFGVARALVVLGLAYLTLNAITPPDRMPAWISQAKLYPLSTASGRTLEAFAPQGSSLVRQVGPIVGQAVDDAGDNSAPPRSTP